jgi:thiamine-phosphate pyrophosphorylase
VALAVGRSAPAALPRLYAILDAGVLARRKIKIEKFAVQMRDAGVMLLQYRDKVGAPEDILWNAALIREVFAGTGARLILNDRVDLAKTAAWDGVHVGQGDVSVASARATMGADAIVGISTHNEAQLRIAAESDANYIAIGPVFATRTKENPDPVVGLYGVRTARLLTDKPIVGIGGVTRNNAASVIAAGADSVAVISELLPKSADETAEKSARDFMLVLG